jgi:electron transfer flavoprotein beta subunit
VAETREIDGGAQTVSLKLPAIVTTSTHKTVKVEAPAARSAGIKVKSVAELVEKLKNEAKVI